MNLHVDKNNCIIYTSATENVRRMNILYCDTHKDCTVEYVINEVKF